MRKLIFHKPLIYFCRHLFGMKITISVDTYLKQVMSFQLFPRVNTSLPKCDCILGEKVMWQGIYICEFINSLIDNFQAILLIICSCSENCNLTE